MRDAWWSDDEQAPRTAGRHPADMRTWEEAQAQRDAQAARAAQARVVPAEPARAVHAGRHSQPETQGATPRQYEPRSGYHWGDDPLDDSLPELRPTHVAPVAPIAVAQPAPEIAAVDRLAPAQAADNADVGPVQVHLPNARSPNPRQDAAQVYRRPAAIAELAKGIESGHYQKEPGFVAGGSQGVAELVFDTRNIFTNRQTHNGLTSELAATIFCYHAERGALPRGTRIVLGVNCRADIRQAVCACLRLYGIEYADNGSGMLTLTSAPLRAKG